MAENNLMIARLKKEGQHIYKMLAPWVRGMLPGSDRFGRLADSTPAIMTKARSAAKKMRFVSNSNQGSLMPANLLLQAQTIKQKTKQVNRLLHIKPGGSKENPFWSKMERVLPSGSAAGPEPAPEPGLLTQGSVIPKMSVFPKEGQSFSDFKQQVESSEIFKQKAEVQVNKPKQPLPNSRLYTRVQEFLVNETANPVEGTSSEPAQPSITGQNLPQPKPAAPIEPHKIQRQIDPIPQPDIRHNISKPAAEIDSLLSAPGPKDNPLEQAASIQSKEPSASLSHPADSASILSGGGKPVSSSSEDIKTSSLDKDFRPNLPSGPAALPSSQPSRPLPGRSKLPLAKPLSSRGKFTLPRAKGVPLEKSPKDTSRLSTEKEGLSSVPFARPASGQSISSVIQRLPEKLGPAVAPLNQPAPLHNPPDSGTKIDSPSAIGSNAQPPLSSATVSHQPPAQTVDSSTKEAGTSLTQPPQGQPSRAKISAASMMVLKKPLMIKKDSTLNPHPSKKFLTQKEFKKSSNNIILPRVNKEPLAPSFLNIAQDKNQNGVQPASPLGPGLWINKTTNPNKELNLLVPPPGAKTRPPAVPDYNPLPLVLSRFNSNKSSGSINNGLPVAPPSTFAQLAPAPLSNNPGQMVQRLPDFDPAQAVENKIGDLKDQTLGKVSDLKDQALGKVGDLKEQALGKIGGKLGLGGKTQPGGSAAGGGSGSLEKLAEDVFPLIKRLLEIETDRSSGNFH